MSISTKDIKELRELTGAGLSDCKKALTEAEGDREKAVELLRKKGQKVSQKRQDRDAGEGAVFVAISDDKKTGVLLSLHCETDFVARNEDFLAAGQAYANAALAAFPADKEGLMQVLVDGKSIENHIVDLVGKIREKIEVGKYVPVKGEYISKYIHHGSKIGVIANFEGTDDVADMAEVSKEICIQIAAMEPLAISKDDVSEEDKEREMNIGREQAREEGKPEQVIEKIAVGKLNAYYKQYVLLDQEYITDTSKSVGAYLKDNGPNLKVSFFQRIHIGG